MKNQFEKLKYERSNLKAGIAHIGLDDFHRAHQAYFVNKLLSIAGNENWAICGIGFSDQDKEFIKKIRSQDYLYTLNEFSSDGSKNTSIIGSIIECLCALDEKEKVIEKLADPSIKIISLGIRESQYNMDIASGEFDFSKPIIKHPQDPKSVFGFLLEALYRRYRKGEVPPTILSCDDIKGNGNMARKDLLEFCSKNKPELTQWIETNIFFPNSTLDRRTFHASAEETIYIDELSQLEDKAPVLCEEFIEWIIEDKFSGERPELEKVGVIFSKELKVYENIKLYVLDASFYMLAYPALLYGYESTENAIKNVFFRKYIEQYTEEVFSILEIPKGFDCMSYTKTLLDRFSNEALGKHLHKMVSDGASKIPLLIFPSLKKLLKEKRDGNKIAFFIACYWYYVFCLEDDIREPLVEKKLDIKPNSIEDLLSILEFGGQDLKEEEKEFHRLCIHYKKEIESKNLLDILISSINS